jgi:putative DNA primase/helicase
MSEPHDVFSLEGDQKQVPRVEPRASTPPAASERASASTTLGNHIQDKRWCAWATRERNNKPTKVPFFGCTTYDNHKVEREARSNDSSTWLRLPSAANVARAICTEDKPGGVGIFLGTGDLIPGYGLGGVDFDTCFDENGALAWWASEAATRLDTYTEVSPSGAGLKSFFLYAIQDVERIAELIRPATTGRQFKIRGDRDHPPGFEWYFRNRFFAVTASHYAPSPETINAVTYEDLVWLTKDLGPRVSKSAVVAPRTRKPAMQNASTQLAHTRSDAAGGVQAAPSANLDQSRSGRAFVRVLHLRRADGLETYDEIKEALLDDPDDGVRDWMNEKGLERDEYEFRRLYEKTKPITSHDRIRCTFAQMHRRHRLAGESDPLHW